jgi:26S proteasome regulatory subunit N3
LTQAFRKAPTQATGFRQTLNKLIVTVQLLLGTIPEKSLFVQPEFRTALKPYFELTKGKFLHFYTLLACILATHPAFR